MTVYVDDIKDQAVILEDAIEAVTDILIASRQIMAPIVAAASVLTTQLGSAIGTLDTQIGSDAVGGLAGVISGTFPPASVTILQDQLANLEQMVTLVDLLGYAGRLHINLTEAGK